MRGLGIMNVTAEDQAANLREPERAGTTSRHRVVIVGAGFGGLQAVHQLAGAPVDVTLVDRRNHHLFQPLLYQVATASLATSEIAWPIRHLLRGRPEVTTLLATVTGVDTDARRVLLDGGGTLPYDTLILRDGRPSRLFRPRRMGAICPGPEDARGRHHDQTPHPARLRACGTRGRPARARSAADLCHRRCWPDRRGARRHHCRNGACDVAAGLP